MALEIRDFSSMYALHILEKVGKQNENEVKTNIQNDYAQKSQIKNVQEYIMLQRFWNVKCTTISLIKHTVAY
jgi:hypothetical protein